MTTNLDTLKGLGFSEDFINEQFILGLKEKVVTEPEVVDYSAPIF